MGHFPRMVLLAIFCLFLLSSFTPSSLASPYSALACRPDMLRLVPARVQEICSLLALVQDGKAKRQDMTGAAAVGEEDAPEHLFLRWFKKKSVILLFTFLYIYNVL